MSLALISNYADFQQKISERINKISTFYTYWRQSIFIF